MTSTTTYGPVPRWTFTTQTTVLSIYHFGANNTRQNETDTSRDFGLFYDSDNVYSCTGVCVFYGFSNRRNFYVSLP